MTESDQIIETVEQRLRLGPGFLEKDRQRVVDVLSSLNRHLAHWRSDAVDLRISVKGRDTLNQCVTLEIWLPAWHSLLAHSHDRELDRALIEVRKCIVREIEDEHARREPHKGNLHHMH